MCKWPYVLSNGNADYETLMKVYDYKVCGGSGSAYPFVAHEFTPGF